MATSTVEDYLKCIHRVQSNSDKGRAATGQLAAALDVAPGTVTAMMKTLTDSGLVDYEPYSGVRLTPEGEKLATHVLRRHRLVEQFLVQVMGMDWSEVHEEAEVLEHAVSDRIIDRMDEMLGRPTVDPHGDPIPTATGQIEQTNYPTLLACPLEKAVEVTRVTDQRAEFLQLLERNQLMPGQRAIVRGRDPLAETVAIESGEGQSLQLGFLAASRVMVKPV